MFAALFSSTKVDFRDGKKGEVLRPRPWESDIRYPYQARKKRSNFRLNRLFFDIPRYIKIRVSAVQERVSRQRFWRCANSGSSKTEGAATVGRTVVLEVCQFGQLQNVSSFPSGDQSVLEVCQFGQLQNALARLQASGRVLEVCQFGQLQNALARSDWVENRLGGRLCDPIGSCKRSAVASLIYCVIHPCGSSQAIGASINAAKENAHASTRGIGPRYEVHGRFLLRSGGSREQCRRGSAAHAREGARQGGSRAAACGGVPRAGARAGQGRSLCTCQTKFGIT